MLILKHNFLIEEIHYNKEKISSWYKNSKGKESITELVKQI